MENAITYTDLDNSCNIYKVVDASTCYIREPFDLSHTFFKEHFEGKEILLGKSVREYFYFTGSPGPPGPEGPAGPTKEYSTTFLNIYNTNQQQVFANSPILFALNNYIDGSCAHNPGTSEIHIWQKGYYYVYTNIYHIEACQFSLYKNKNTIVPGSTIGSLTGSCQNSCLVIVQISEDDICNDCPYAPNGKACVLEVYNKTPYIPFVTLYDISGLGYINPQINATLTLFLLKSN
jgi:hypothetical protein